MEAEVEDVTQHKIEKTAYELLEESRISMEEIVAKMLFIKKEGRPKSELRELVTQMFIHFVNLRQANRTILLEEDRVKAETERVKAPVDFTTLQLHNLVYEKNHYVKAIKTCKDFKSKHPDIELVPEEEFFSSAPEDIKQTLMSNDTSHDLMLKRLNFELFQRKELCKLHEKLEQQKKGLLETIANRKKFLSSLPSHLKSLKKASLPVQQQLGVLHTKKLKQHHSAELLPPPLYVIYSQLSAQKEAFGENIDLEIVGSMKDAQAFARQQANKDTGVSVNMETSKMEDDAPDEEDDGQRRRKRPKKVPSKESIDQEGICQVHPLKVILYIYDDGVPTPKPVKLVSLRFEYLLKLNVVCAGIEGPYEGPENDILCNLFPDDTGIELPHQSAKFVIGDSIMFDERRSLRPYKWAQHLAGIDFLPEVPPLVTGCETLNVETAKSAAVISGLSMYRQQNRVQTVVQRIRSRKKAQLALAEQFEALRKLKWPDLIYDNVPWAVHTPLCNLHSWSHVGPLQDLASSSSVTVTQQVPNSVDHDIDGRSGMPREDVESAREDGELPSLVLAPPSMNDAKLTPSKGSDLEHSIRMALLSKSIIPTISKGKSPSFKRHDEDSDLILDIGSDMDEPSHIEAEMEDASLGCYGIVEKSWVDHGAKEFSLVLIRTTDKNEKEIKLEAKIKVFVEYPLRPPLFAVSLCTVLGGESSSESDGSEWYNELRAMEAEVNLHILKMLPAEYENYILAHQVRCLAMLFDFCMDEASSQFSEKRKNTCVVDVGLCKPVSGGILVRSFRGRDRRKMISWKNMGCTPGYPY